MSITALILDATLSPISEDIEILSDVDFGVAEKLAIDSASNGVRCCIQWRRSNDTQMAYWGPRGASITPHWYAKPGRPAQLGQGRRLNVYLDANTIGAAQLIGAGNLSEGLRRAVLAYQ